MHWNGRRKGKLRTPRAQCQELHYPKRASPKRAQQDGAGCSLFVRFALGPAQPKLKQGTPEEKRSLTTIAARLAQLDFVGVCLCAKRDAYSVCFAPVRTEFSLERSRDEA